jgi:HK97 family phage major capsid protein
MNAPINKRSLSGRRIKNSAALERLAQTLQRATSATSAKTAMNILARGVGDLVGDIERSKPFASLGEHLQAIARACGDTRVVDSRLIRAPAGPNENDPTAGGFLIQTQWSAGLVGLAYEEAVLAPLCDRRETSRPLADVRIPGIDETSRADGSRCGGFTSYWASEASSVSAGFPRWKNLDFSGKKLIGVCVVSNELLNDTPMLEAHIARGFAAEFGFKLDLVSLSGTGAGVPQGILNSTALITVAKETGQAPATILPENIDNMWSRLPAPSRKRAVWLVNEDVEKPLTQMTGANANALYMPAGTGGNPYPLLKGRPVLVMEQSAALGSVGDIVLADPSHYIIVDGGIRPALSAHVRFDNDEAKFRFVLRVDGRSAFTSAITPYNGSSTRSPFVALAAR